MPIIKKSLNELTTFIAFPDVDLVIDYQKAYYGIPREYRTTENPQDNDPGYCYLGDCPDDNKEVEAFRECLNLMSQWYWKILFEDAQRTYEAHKPK